MTAVDLGELARQQQGYAVRLAAEFGFHVFPADHPALRRCAGIKTKTHDPDTCTERGKHPACKWSEYATADPELLQAPHHFGGSRPRNIGIGCKASRLLVLDEDAERELDRFCADHGVAVPETFTVQTSDGRHFYFRAPDGLEHGNSEGAFGPYEINVRGPGGPNSDGGYVIAPGSLHASGAVYTVADGTREIIPAPEWVLEAIKAPARSRDSSGEDKPGFDWDRALTPGAIPSGKQRPALVSAACSLRELGTVDRLAVPLLRRVVEAFANDPDREAWTPEYADEIWEWAKSKYEPGEKIPVVPAWVDAPRSNGQTSGLATGDLVAREAARLRAQRAARRLVDAEERPPVEPPEILTLRERLVRPRPAVAWRIDGWQPADSRVVLAAQYKAGKTTLTGNLARTLVDGDPFLGRYDVAPVSGTVGLLDLEMSARQIDDWLADQNIRNDDRVIPIPLRGMAGAVDLLDPERRAYWAQQLRDRGIAYLIIDCLRPLLDALGLDEHRDAGRALGGLEALLAEAGIAEALVVHHMGHGPERSRGDSRIRDWPDVEWRLVREDPDDPASPRYVSAIGRDVEIGEARLDYDPATRRLSLVGGSRKDVAARGALEDVLAFLDSEPWPSVRQVQDGVAEVTEHGQKTVRAALKLGVREGSITTKPGPRGAILHTRPCQRGRPCHDRGRHGQCECVSASIADTHTRSQRTTSKAGGGDTVKPAAEEDAPVVDEILAERAGPEQGDLL